MMSESSQGFSPRSVSCFDPIGAEEASGQVDTLSLGKQRPALQGLRERLLHLIEVTHICILPYGAGTATEYPLARQP